MKKIRFNDIVTKSCMSIFCAVILCSLSTSCSKDDDVVDDGEEEYRTHIVTSYDDLFYFQDIFIGVDSLGTFLYRSVGQPLPTLDEDTTHLFVGVDNIDEALKYLDMSLAPDISRYVSENNSYTYTLSDFNGVAQGTVCFAPGTETNHVAEITTNLPGLKHFKRITFLDNEAWPIVANSGKYRLGDSREDKLDVGYWVDDIYSVAHYTQKFICIREKANGVKPLYVGITDDSVTGFNCRITSQWCPNVGVAKTISGIIKSDYDFYKACFDAAGITYHKGWLYWINDIENNFFYTDCGCICLDTGEIDHWDITWHNPGKHVVMKIDWEDD